MKLIRPFSQIITLDGLLLKGAIDDAALQIVLQGGVLVEDGIILKIGEFQHLAQNHPEVEIEPVFGEQVLLPGFVDCHTHICFAGTRSKDYSLRIAGKSYLEIAQSGGGIWDSVSQTRLASEEELAAKIVERANRHFYEGVTTIEVKSGYGLNFSQEIKQLSAIKSANAITAADLIPTCLAAHIVPKDFDGSAFDYLQYIISELLPVLLEQNLAKRVDIFVEDKAFTKEEALFYLSEARKLGFDLTVHADQFSTGGTEVAVALNALSADHLEASGAPEITLLAQSNTIAVVLPGASLGLGMPCAPSRKLLDAGCSVAISSDWNPGSAPMGDLLLQAALISASEKLSNAETFAGLCVRAAAALGLFDRGVLAEGKLVDMQAYPCADYREILYHQGRLKPKTIWKNGKKYEKAD